MNFEEIMESVLTVDIDSLMGETLPSPQEIDALKDNSDRRLWIYEDITESLLGYAKRIIRWNRDDAGIPIEERKPITIYIYSYGGDGNACLSFIDTIRLSKTPIKVICSGVAMSAGAYILLAAPKGNRYITRHATVLLHQGSTATAGTAEAVLASSKDYQHFLKELETLTLESTNIDKKTWNKFKTKEWYLYADDCIKYGIADKIIDDIDEII